MEGWRPLLARNNVFLASGFCHGSALFSIQAQGDEYTLGKRMVSPGQLIQKQYASDVVPGSLTECILPLNCSQPFWDESSNYCCGSYTTGELCVELPAGLVCSIDPSTDWCQRQHQRPRKAVAQCEINSSDLIARSPSPRNRQSQSSEVYLLPRTGNPDCLYHC